jgi:hypothetical protein
MSSCHDRRGHQDAGAIFRPKAEPLVIQSDNARAARLHHFDLRPYAQPHLIQPMNELGVAEDLCDARRFAGWK